MIKLYLSIVLIISTELVVFSQNYFTDPYFDEPKNKVSSSQNDCENRGVVFDLYSDVYFRIGNGSPDIIVPVEDRCKLHIDNPLIKSQCLGLAFSFSPNSKAKVYKEPVYTKLASSLSIAEKYELSFDILINPSFLSQKNNITSYNAEYFNVILIDRSTKNKDTLRVPIPLESQSNWSRAKLDFTCESAYDAVQFDFCSEEFYSSKEIVRLYAVLDNFSLLKRDSSDVNMSKNAELSSPKLNEYTSTETLVYYFDSDKDCLSNLELERLQRDMNKMRLYDVQSIDISAFTDNTSTLEYNELLSRRRARSIQSVIKELFTGDVTRIIAAGKGVDQRNFGDKARRVEVRIVYEEKEIAPWYQTSTNEQYFINYSFLGNTELCKEKGDVPKHKKFQEKNLKLDEKPFNAYNLILSRARTAKVLIINESHSSPSHRAFISNLLPNLKDMGFNKLAVEAIREDDNPQSLSIKDPLFLRYLKDAQNRGYDLLSYDSKTYVEPNWDDIEQIENVDYSDNYRDISREMNIRDYNQFLNLEDHIDGLKDNEKMIIHVGHAHGNKTQIGEWKALGVYLVEKYGVNAILSLDQVTLNDCCYWSGNDYYKYYSPIQPVVCSEGQRPYVEKVFNPLTFDYEEANDLQILHPLMDAKLNIDTSVIYVQHNVIEDASYPLAIMVYERDSNPKTDVAYSAVEVINEDDIKASVIPNYGAYQVLIKDSENKIIFYDSNNRCK